MSMQRTGALRGEGCWDLLGYGREDAEPGTKLFDGSPGFEPAVPLLLLRFEKLITEMLPLLRGERAQDPATVRTGGESGHTTRVQLNVYALCICLSGRGIMTFELLFFFFPKKKEETFILIYIYLAIGGDKNSLFKLQTQAETLFV